MTVKRKSRKLVIGSSWADAEIDVRCRFEILKVLVLAAIGLLFFVAVVFALQKDRQGLVIIVGIASNILTGITGWALRRQRKR